MGGCSADVVGLDWATDISAARAALGPSRPVQVGRRVHHACLHACSSARVLKGHVYSMLVVLLMQMIHHLGKPPLRVILEPETESADAVAW